MLLGVAQWWPVCQIWNMAVRRDPKEKIQQTLSAIDELRPGGFDEENEVLRLSELVRALDDSVTRARLAFQRQRTTEHITMAELLTRNLKELRAAAGWTQAELAVSMVRLGHSDWKRMTVAHIESGKRRPSWEELLSYCLLFGIPLVDLITPEPGERLVVSEQIQLDPFNAKFLVGGLHEEMSRYGLGVNTITPVAADVLDLEPYTDDDWRPGAAVERIRSHHPSSFGHSIYVSHRGAKDES